MANGVLAVISGAIVVAVGWAYSDQKKRMQQQTKTIKKTVKTGPDFGDLAADEIFNFALDSFSGWGRKQSTGAVYADYPTSTPARPARAQTVSYSPPKQTGGVGGLLDLIGSVEAPKGYNQVYGGIRRADQPPKALTSMTVQEVLDWQDSIDSKYRSEAAGRYQIMEDTLRGLVREGKARPNEKFSASTQDRLATSLMERRGLSRYQSGKMSAKQFANNLSKEWASLPATIRDRKGRTARGQSYYAGDGLNRSHVTIDKIMGALGGLV